MPRKRSPDSGGVASSSSSEDDDGRDRRNNRERAPDTGELPARGESSARQRRGTTPVHQRLGRRPAPSSTNRGNGRGSGRSHAHETSRRPPPPPLMAQRPRPPRSSVRAVPAPLVQPAPEPMDESPSTSRVITVRTTLENVVRKSRVTIVDEAPAVDPSSFFVIIHEAEEKTARTVACQADDGYSSIAKHRERRAKANTRRSERRRQGAPQEPRLPQPSLAPNPEPAPPRRHPSPKRPRRSEAPPPPTHQPSRHSPARTPAPPPPRPRQPTRKSTTSSTRPAPSTFPASSFRRLPSPPNFSSVAPRGGSQDAHEEEASLRLSRQGCGGIRPRGKAVFRRAPEGAPAFPPSPRNSCRGAILATTRCSRRGAEAPASAASTSPTSPRPIFFSGATAKSSFSLPHFSSSASASGRRRRRVFGRRVRRRERQRDEKGIREEAPGKMGGQATSPQRLPH